MSYLSISFPRIPQLVSTVSFQKDQQSFWLQEEFMMYIHLTTDMRDVFFHFNTRTTAAPDKLIMSKINLMYTSFRHDHLASCSK